MVNQAERGVRLGKRIVQFQRLLGSSFRPRQILLRRARSVNREQGACIGPKMSVCLGPDQLDVHADRVRRALDAALQNIRHPKLLRYCRQIIWRTLETLGRKARDHLQFSNLCQSRNDLVLNPGSEISVIWITTKIGEGEDRY